MNEGRWRSSAFGKVVISRSCPWVAEQRATFRCLGLRKGAEALYLAILRVIFAVPRTHWKSSNLR